MVRTVQSPGTLVRVGAAEVMPLRVREQVRTGDALRTTAGARAELTLAERNLLRLGRGTEIALLPPNETLRPAERLAALELRQGTVQLVLEDGLPLALRPIVQTGNAVTELDGPGAYVLRADGLASTLVIVRHGRASLSTGGGVIVVHSGDEVVVQGPLGEVARRTRARGPLDLELWGRLLAPDGRLSYAGASSGGGFWPQEFLRLMVAVADVAAGPADEPAGSAEQSRPPKARTEAEKPPGDGDAISEPEAEPPLVNPVRPRNRANPKDRSAPRPKPKPREVEPPEDTPEAKPPKKLPEAKPREKSEETEIREKPPEPEPQKESPKVKPREEPTEPEPQKQSPKAEPRNESPKAGSRNESPRQAEPRKESRRAAPRER